MASSQVQTVGSAADKAKVVLSVVLAVAAFVAFYVFAAQAPVVRWLVLLCGLAFAVVVLMLSQSGKDLAAFGKDSWRELRKVVWPSRKEATQVTIYVFLFVAVMAVFLFLTDKTLEWVFYDLILGWKK